MSIGFTWPQVLGKLASGHDLNRAEATWCLEQIMLGDTDFGVVVAFLTALRRKGETVDELSGLVDAMLSNSLKLNTGANAVDLVGTGGDLIGTVNISSMAAVLTASAGVPVLKHGSRSASGKTGSAEMLEALGVRLNLEVAEVAQVFSKVGITFFFAPVFHPAMRFLAPIRKLLAVPTTFNFLGPLANPAQPVATALGVSNRETAPLMAAELGARGRSGLVFRGLDGLDELSTTSGNEIWQVSGGEVRYFELDGLDFGLRRSETSELLGGNAEFNAEVTKKLFAGDTAGNLAAIREIVILNAAGAVVSYELARDASRADVDLKMRFTDAIQKVTVALESGAAEAKLQDWVACTA